MHLNVNSYRHKFGYISDMLNKQCVDYLAISETKLDDSFHKSQFMVEGYSLYRQDLTNSSGGLLVYVRDDLPHRRMVHVEINKDGFESLCLELTIGKSKTILSCIYKHPKVTKELFFKYFCDLSDSLLRSHEDLIYLGDMNCCPTKSSAIQDISEQYDLTNLIKEPTCHKGPTPSLLDVILVSNARRYADTLNVLCSISDFHSIIGAATKRFVPSQKPRTIHYRSYKNFDESEFLNSVASAPFHVIDIFDEIDDMAWYTSALMRNIIDEHAPMKTRVVKCDSVPYMTSALRKAQYKRNMARNRFRRFGKQCWEENRRARNHVVKIRKQSMQKYFKEHCLKHDRNFRATISPFFSDKRLRNGHNISLRENDNVETDPSNVSELFNDYLSRVAMDIGFDDRISSTSDAVDKHNSHPSVMKIRQQYGNESTFRFNLVDENCVALILRNINPRKATGYDHIPGKIVRIAHQELSFPITRLINTAITANAFPSNMKLAEISPGHKKDDNLIRGNYRPVSVLPILSNVYETVMNDPLFGYFLDKFLEFLSAFRKRYSCQSVLLKAVDDWKYALDQNLKTGVVFMDLSKAFDCLPHNLLIAKVHAYGVDWSACELLADYLSHRLQRVKIETARSSWAELSKGVPQGSILGPLLFNIFVNDLFLFVEKCTLYNYADDNSMSYSSSTLQDALSSLLNDCKIAVEWFGNNGMKANPTKFQFMVLSPNPTDDIELKLDENTILKPEKSVKALGVIIDNRLTFSDHISACCLKAARQLNALARISKYLDPKSKNVIYNSFIRSNFEYCPLSVEKQKIKNLKRFKNDRYEFCMILMSYHMKNY